MAQPKSINHPKNGQRILWSKGELETLKLLLEAKVPMNELAQSLCRSEKAIRRKCEAMDWSSATVYQKLKISKKSRRKK